VHVQRSLSLTLTSLLLFTKRHGCEVLELWKTSHLFPDGSLDPYEFTACYGGGVSRSQNPHFNPIPEAWLAIHSFYSKK